jgi:hypothetical protein
MRWLERIQVVWKRRRVGKANGSGLRPARWQAPRAHPTGDPSRSKFALAILCFVLVSAPAYAQVNPQALTLAGVSDCVQEAIATGSVEDSGSVIIYSCSEIKAKTLYNFLGRKVRAQIVQDRNGKFENRPFGNNACYHRVEDPSGKAADDFRCDLILAIGDILSE